MCPLNTTRKRTTRCPARPYTSEHYPQAESPSAPSRALRHTGHHSGVRLLPRHAQNGALRSMCRIHRRAACWRAFGTNGEAVMAPNAPLHVLTEDDEVNIVDARMVRRRVRRRGRRMGRRSGRPAWLSTPHVDARHKGRRMVGEAGVRRRVRRMVRRKGPRNDCAGNAANGACGTRPHYDRTVRYSVWPVEGSYGDTGR